MAGSVALEGYRKDIVDVFNFYCDKLSSVLEGCMESFVKKAYSAQLISEQVMKDKNFTSVFSEFKAGLDLKSTEEEMQKHCKCFIKILEDLGGPAASAGKCIAEKLSTLNDLSNLLSQYGLNDVDVEKECDERLIIEVSQRIDDYKRVGHSLKLTDEMLKEITQNKSDDIERNIAVLWAWKRKNGSAATSSTLVKVFLKLEGRFVAEFILKHLMKQKTEPHQTNVQGRLDPQKANEHYPNWNDLSESEKEGIKNDLEEKNRNVREAYTVFVSKLTHSFIKRNVDPMVIRLLANSYNDGHLFTEPVVLGNGDSVATVFYELSKHCTWFNYELFRVIVKVEGNDEEKKYLQTYENDHLSPYLKLSIFEIPFTPGQDPSRTHLLLKVSAELCITGSQVKAIQQNLVKLLGFKQNSALLHFEDYNVGCIELVFSLPTVLISKSPPKSQLLTYIEWQESQKCYRVNVDLVTILSFSESPEVSMLIKLLHDALKLITLSSENQDIRNETEKKLDPVSQILQKHSEYLSQAVLSVEVVQMLYTENVISKETYDDVERLGGLLATRLLQSSISKDLRKLRVYASILLHSKKTVPIGQNILQDCGEIFQQGFLLPSQHVNIQEKRTTFLEDLATKEQYSEDGIIKEPPHLHSFNSLQQGFITLVSALTHLIADNLSSLRELKMYLQRSFRELKPQLAHAKSSDDVVAIIVGKYNIINVDCLEAIVDHLDVKEAKDHITAYKKKADEFCKEISLSMCCNENFKAVSLSCLLTCETVQFTLKWNADEHKLIEVQDLLTSLFKSNHDRVYITDIIMDIHIIVTCYVPKHIVDVLLIETTKNVVKEFELLKLTIGYSRVLDESEKVIIDVNLWERQQSIEKMSKKKSQELEKLKTSFKELKGKFDDKNSETIKLLSESEEKDVKINELTENLKVAINKLETATEVSRELVKSFKSQIAVREQKIDELEESLIGIKHSVSPSRFTKDSHYQSDSLPEVCQANSEEQTPLLLQAGKLSLGSSPPQIMSSPISSEANPNDLAKILLQKPIATKVCQHCHKINPNDLSLLDLKCTSVDNHNQRDKILVTEDCGTLVEIRPLPNEFRPPAYFRMCYDAEESCQSYPRCTYAHSEAEQRVWNMWLKDEQSQPHAKPVSNSKPSSQLPPKTFVAKDTYLRRQRNPPPAQDMILPVHLRTYRRKFKALLYYEEEEHIEVLQAKCDGQYKLTTIRPQDIPSKKRLELCHFYAYIEGMSGSQIAYAIQASSHAMITISDLPQIEYKAKLLSCNYDIADENLYIGLDDEKTDVFSHVLNVKVKFEVNHSYFDRLNTAVTKVSDDALKRIIPGQDNFSEGIDPRQIPKPQYPQDLPDLNEDQLRGLQRMLFSPSSAPVLIPGPFGSGKTCLLAVASSEIFRESKEKQKAGRVLICCHHQDSADIFMTDYFQKMLRNKLDIEVVRVTIRNRQEKVKKAKYVSTIEFKETFHTNYETKQHLVIVTTFGGAFHMSEVVPKDYFTHILIDEGAQTREPETITPLIMANENTRIVIAGDIKQVGPKLLVLGDEPQRHGLGVSLIKRLHKQYTIFGSTALNFVVTLNCNYRCHANLMELSSSLFYKSKLKACADVKCHPLASYPLKFICSSFDNSIPSSPESPSEVLLILNEVKEVVKYEGWYLKDVCIMAVSYKQANLIRKTIFGVSDYHCLRGIDVRTSYQMQGQEYTCLFISTVESLQQSGRPFDVLKSVCHPAIFNTVITRSKSLVVAIGNPLVLMMCEATMDEQKWCWREFITRCMMYKTFIVPDNLDYDRVKSQFKRIRRSRDCNEIMTLFQGEGVKSTPPKVT